jgi:hypothetical protein
MIGLILLFGCISLLAQTNRANIKASPQVLQTKPQTDIHKIQTKQLIASLPSDRQKTFKTVSAIGAKQLIENFQSDKSDIRKEDDARQIITAVMDKTAIITNAANEKALIQNTMLAANYGLQANVNQIAAKVATSNQIKSILREEITMLMDILSDWFDDGSAKKITYNSCIKIADDRYEIVEKTEVMSKEQAEALIEKMDSQLEALSDMSQQLQLQLQDAMNKQQQAMQMISNIMKTMHDTAKAIIQNMK